MATLQKRTPARMELSGRVAQNAPLTRKPPKRRTNTPFSGMNVTEAKIRGQPQRTSPAEERRTFRFKKDAPKSGTKTGPFKALKMQRALTSVTYDKRASVKERIADRDTFRAFDLLPELQAALPAQVFKGLTDLSPTPIQRLAISALLGADTKRTRRKSSEPNENMQQYLLAAETGSGKTLAYLLPIVNAIKRAEAAERAEQTVEDEKEDRRKRDSLFSLPSPTLSNEIDSTSGRPRAVILLPTSELVDQVAAVAKSISHAVKFRVAHVSSSYSPTIIRNRLFRPDGIDLVISTPHILSSIADHSPNILARVQHLVVDEADSLFDRSFAPITTNILDRATPSLKQLVLCSATIPRTLDSYIRKNFPDIQRLTTPNLHAIPRRVQLSVVEVEKDPYKGNKDLACADTIWSIGSEATDATDGPADRVKRMIVFVNEREKTFELATYLRSKGIDATALSRDSNDRNEAELLASFTGQPMSASASKSSKQDLTLSDSPAEIRVSGLDSLRSASRGGKDPHTPAVVPRRHLSNVKVLVTTDITSRGIDTTPVRHVLLYDVPHSSIDFIHRLGRVGRMGRRGRGFVFVGKGDRRDVVREVREGMFKGMALI